MNLLETLLALLAGLACTAALALCAHDLRARTQAIQEAAMLQEAARQALAWTSVHAGELEATASAGQGGGQEASPAAPGGALLALDPARLGIAPPPEGRSLHVALAGAGAMTAAGGGDGSASDAPSPRFLRLFVWLEGADPLLAARAALALPRGWHADAEGRLVWPSAAGGGLGQAWPSPAPGAFGTACLVPAATGAPSLAARRKATGADGWVRRTWSPPAAPGAAQDQHGQSEAGGRQAAVPAMNQSLDMQGHALQALASLGLAKPGAGTASGATSGAASGTTSGAAGGQEDAVSGGQPALAATAQERSARHLQALAEAGLDAVEQACRDGALEGVLVRGEELLHICRQRRFLPLLAREDRPSLAGIVAFAAGETPPGEPAHCPAGRTPAVFYTPAAYESRSQEATLNLGMTLVFWAAFQGPVDQSFQWVAVQACL